jgi:hypothetical protein
MSTITKFLMGAAAVAAAALGSAAIAGAAQSGASTTTRSSQPPAAVARTMPAHGSAAHEDAEKAVTGSAPAKAKAAAVKSVGGGSAGEVTTDFQGDGYEVTVTKSDGSSVELHLDGAYNVMQGAGSGR